MLEVLKSASEFSTAVLPIISLIILIVKPFRTRVILWIKKQSGSEETKKEVSEIKRMTEVCVEHDKLIDDKIQKISDGLMSDLRNNILEVCERCLKRESITTLEKLNLIDMYNDYHKLGGDTYCTDRFELAMDLDEIN